MAKVTVSQVQNTLLDDRTDVQRHALRMWRVPQWANAAKAGVKPIKPLPKRQEITTATWLSNPSYCNPPEVWAAWYSAYCDNVKVNRPGVVVDKDGAVPLRNIRGMMLVGRHAPSRSNALYEQNRTVFQTQVAELLIMAGQYRQVVANQGLTIVTAPAEAGRYKGNLANLTVEDVAKFFVAQSVTVVQVDDAYMYADQWFTDTIYARPMQAAELKWIWDEAEVYADFMGVTLPPPSLVSDQDDVWRPLTMATPVVAVATVPKMVTVMASLSKMTKAVPSIEKLNEFAQGPFRKLLEGYQQ
jgi:hypothetical protein